MTGIPVLAACAIDPGQSRVDVMRPDRLTIAEIFCVALPGLSDSDRSRCRVTNTAAGAFICTIKWPSSFPHDVIMPLRIMPTQAGDRYNLARYQTACAIMNSLVVTARLAVLTIQPAAGLALVFQAVSHHRSCWLPLACKVHADPLAQPNGQTCHRQTSSSQICFSERIAHVIGAKSHRPRQPCRHRVQSDAYAENGNTADL